MERWTEHFKHLLNPTTTSGNSVLSIVEASESLEIDLGQIRFDEVLNAVRKLKNGKASGPDNISAEMLKLHIGIAEWLWDIVNKCWTGENLPQDWKLAEVVSLYKSKGKRSKCGNYRGISLLSVPGKVFVSIILNRSRIKDHLRSLMTIVVYVQVVNVASTLQEAAKCMKPDSASLRIRRGSKTARQSLLG